MRTPFWEFLIVELEMVTVLTVLSERPPTLPIESPMDLSVKAAREKRGSSPWPPEHVPPVKEMLVPLLIARQSSWF